MGTRRTVVVAAAAALVLTGCWAMPGQGPDRRSHNAFEQVVTVESAERLEQAWEAQVAPNEPTYGTPVGDPVLSTGGVHVAAGGLTHGLDPRTGAALWTHRTAPDEYGGGWAIQPLALGDEVLAQAVLGSMSGRPAGREWLDGRTGRPVDEMDTGADLDTATTRYLVGRSFDRSTAQTGAVHLSVADRAEPANSWYGLLSLAGQDARAVTLGRHFVYESGWGPFGADPSVGPGPGVRAFALEGVEDGCGPDGYAIFLCPSWATSLEGLGSPVTSPVLGPGEDALYVGTDAGNLVALDPADGTILWTAPLGSGPSDEPALADEILYVALEDGRLVALPVAGCPASCSVAWSSPLGSPGGQPAVAGGAVVVGTDTGRLVALDGAGCGAATCAPLWDDDLGAPVTGDPAISGGRVYVGTGDGRLVAYAPSPAGP